MFHLFFFFNDTATTEIYTLSLHDALPISNGRVGEPIAMTATVSGAGNVALWPEPAIRWPPGFRPYPGETGMRIAARDGRIAGTKVFHYLVMPDSAGSFLLPEVRYPYYDLAAGDYRVATIAPRALAVAPGIEPHAARALPPLARGRDPAWADEVARGLVPWGWRSEEHTSELQSPCNLVCRLLLEKKK